MHVFNCLEAAYPLLRFFLRACTHERFMSFNFCNEITNCMEGEHTTLRTIECVLPNFNLTPAYTLVEGTRHWKAALGAVF